MKKINLLIIGVLICTAVFANGTDEPDSSSSSVSVTNSSGSSLFKVHYTADELDDVNISILNTSGKTLFKETIRNTRGFVRPYNFGTLREGRYVIKVKNSTGIQEERVYYHAGKVVKIGR